MHNFAVGDHVENGPPATVDGIVYKVEGDSVSFCDEYGINYRINAEGIRPRYKPFNWAEKNEILRTNAPKFKKLRLYK